MNKIDLEKNVLYLAYKRNLQLLNIVLISGLGALFAYTGALILNPEKIVTYTFVMILVGAITYIIYKNIDETLRKISNQIKKLR
ncbi:MAG: hypothetical protein KKA64_01545 [Nanoarchaeota archaeon]|nr:hypothetical protein [Nanoarchaeota archaeon]